jgi:tetratricopeptide (TPR) repeat protein
MDAKLAEQALALAQRSTEDRLRGQLGEAIAGAREACALAAKSGDERARAYAAFAHANALLELHERGENELALGQAMRRLEEAAEIYERIDHVNFCAVLLAMADTARAIGEYASARSLFKRVASDLAEPRWAEQARHLDRLRGRAFVGLGAVALALGDKQEAAPMFESAANLLIAAGDGAALPLLADLADTLETELDDAVGAARIRAAMARISG